MEKEEDENVHHPDSDWLYEADMDKLFATSTPTKMSAREKRSLTESSPSGFTPTSKAATRSSTPRLSDVAEVLKYSLQYKSTGLVSRDSLLKLVERKLGSPCTPHILTRALNIEFPESRKYGKDKAQYINIVLQKQAAFRGLRSVSQSREESLCRCDKRQSSSADGCPTPAKIRRKDSGLLYDMSLSYAEVKIIDAFRKDDYAFLTKELTDKGYKQFFIDSILKILNDEIRQYSTDSTSHLYKSDADNLADFSLQSLTIEFETKLPTLMSTILKLIEKRDSSNANKSTTIATTIVAKILSATNQKLSSLRYVNGVILDTGGAKDSCISRLQRTGDSVTPQVLRRKLTDMSSLTSKLMQGWTESSIVYDNVNPYVKPRHQTSTKGNKIYNMTHGLIVRDRVPSSHLSKVPAKAPEELVPTDLMPAESDRCIIDASLIRILCSIWSTSVHSLSWMATKAPKHKFSSYTRQKTEFVNLGVMMKDENKIDELLEVLTYYQTFVTKNESKLDPKLCFGDHLSFNNGKLAQATQSDNGDAEGRLEGLIMAISDFHAMMNLLDVLFKTSFTADSARSPGTLSHAKVFLNASNAGSQKDSHKKYYDSSELAEKVFWAYAVTEILERLKMESPDSDCPIPKDQQTAKCAERLAREFIVKYVDLTLPTEHSQDNSKKCPHCTKRFKTMKGLTSHLEKKHPEMPEQMPESCGGDGINNYTIHLTTLSLLRLSLKEAVKTGNGHQVMTVYKYMFLVCKAVGNHKYANSLAETLMQIKILPQSLSVSLMWNRFCNTRGKPDSNIPIDLFMEHQNKFFKEQLKTYRGEYTQNPIDRISKSQSVVSQILDSFDDATSSRGPSTHGTAPLNQEDIMRLVKVYRTANLFQAETGRQHSAGLVMTRKNVMSCLSSSEVDTWLLRKIAVLRGAHYYKQFFVPDEDGEIFSELEHSFNTSFA